MLGVTVDELLSGNSEKETRILPAEQRKNIDDMMLKIIINSSDGDKVRINLPIPLVKLGLEMGMKMPQVSGNQSLQNVDFAQLMALVESGVIGRLLELESAEGDSVVIVVE